MSAPFRSSVSTSQVTVAPEPYLCANPCPDKYKEKYKDKYDLTPSTSDKNYANLIYEDVQNEFKIDSELL